MARLHINHQPAGLSQHKSHESLNPAGSKTFSNDQFSDLLHIHAYQKKTPVVTRLDSQSTIMERKEDRDYSPHGHGDIIMLLQDKNRPADFPKSCKCTTCLYLTFALFYF